MNRVNETVKHMLWKTIKTMAHEPQTNDISDSAASVSDSIWSTLFDSSLSFLWYSQIGPHA